MNQQASASSTRLVYVVDDDAAVRKSLHFALASSGITAWPFSEPEDFLDQIDYLKPAPVLLDLRMKSLDGMQVLQKLSDRGNHWPVVIFSAYGDIPTAVRAMQLGAFDFVEKPIPLAQLEEIIQSCSDTLAVVIENTRAAEDAKVRLASLTQREGEILRQLIKGSSNKTVADILEVSCRTVEIHRSNALKKLGVKSLTQVADLMLVQRSGGFSYLNDD